MEDTAAVLDAPELEAEEIESGEVESQETGDSAESQTTEQQTEEQDEPSIIESDGKLKLSEKALATLTELKAKDPKLAKEFRAALFDSASFRKHFPEGARQAEQLTSELEEYGGIDGVGSMKGELDAWKGLDADWTNNKPQFATEMAESNPSAFAFHAPHVMDKFAEVAPEAFTHKVSQIFAADMDANRVEFNGALLENLIFDESGKARQGMEAIARQWNPIAKYIARIGQLAKTPPKTEQKTETKTTSEVDQREQALTVREFKTERKSVKSAITEAEFKKNAGTRKLPADKVSTIQELYESALNRAVLAVPGHKEKVDRYLAAKDRTGYRKYMDGIIRSKAPAAMQAAFRRAGVGDKPGPKKVETRPVAKTETTAVTGFNRVGTNPNYNDVDWQATARIAGKKGGDGKYILRDGSKVLFQR